MMARLNFFNKKYFQDSMERVLSKRHIAMLFSLYGLILLCALGALTYAGTRFRTRTIPVGSISVTTPYDTYLVGETITFAVHNRYNSTISFANHCPEEPLAVYREINGQWQRLHDRKNADLCQNQKKRVDIRSQQQITGTFEGLPKLFAQPGKYRIVAFVDYFNAVAYKDITVVDKPTPPAMPVSQPTIPITRAPVTTSTTRTSGTNTAPTQTSALPSPGQPSQPTARTISLGVGTVNLTYTATTITLGTITPQAGCTYETNRRVGSNIEINFKCPGGETKLELAVQNGSLVQRIGD